MIEGELLACDYCGRPCKGRRGLDCHERKVHLGTWAQGTRPLTATCPRGHAREGNRYPSGQTCRACDRERRELEGDRHAAGGTCTACGRRFVDDEAYARHAPAEGPCGSDAELHERGLWLLRGSWRRWRCKRCGRNARPPARGRLRLCAEHERAYDRRSRQRVRDRARAGRVCARCGGPVPLELKLGTRYCSARCRHRDYYGVATNAPPVCRVCGAVLEPGSLRSAYCGPACAAEGRLERQRRRRAA